jgi:hypothetical protein
MSSRFSDMEFTIDEVKKNPGNYIWEMKCLGEYNVKLKKELNESEEMVEQYSQDADRTTEAEAEVERLREKCEQLTFNRNSILDHLADEKRIRLYLPWTGLMEHIECDKQDRQYDKVGRTPEWWDIIWSHSAMKELLIKEV